MPPPQLRNEFLNPFHCMYFIHMAKMSLSCCDFKCAKMYITAVADQRKYHLQTRQRKTKQLRLELLDIFKTCLQMTNQLFRKTQNCSKTNFIPLSQICELLFASPSLSAGKFLTWVPGPPNINTKKIRFSTPYFWLSYPKFCHRSDNIRNFLKFPPKIFFRKLDVRK